MELLVHMVALFLVFCKSSIAFSTETVPIYIPNNSAQGFLFLHVLTNICYLCFSTTAILKSVRWYHIAVLICISRAKSRVFSSTAIWKHQFFSTQPSLWSISHICTWLLEKSLLWLYGPLLAKWCNVSICFLGFSKFSYVSQSLLWRNNCILISWLQSPSTVVLEPQK